MKYYFWGPEFKPAYVMFKEILCYPAVRYIRFVMPSYVFVKLYDSFKWIRPFIKKYITKIGMAEDEPAVCIYFNPWGGFLAKSGCLDLIRNRYKQAMHVVLLFDAIVAKTLDIEYLKNAYDEVYIYDQEMAEKFEISFIPPCYSKNFETPSEELEIYDVSFVGHAKGRLPEIIEAYEKLTAIGLKCKFYVVGVESSKQKHKDGIVYEKKYLSEEEYFHSYIASSKCLLEIANADVSALTARVREAVMYDKKILSNNKKLKNYKYYREDMMHIYENIEEIDIKFFDNKKQSYNYEGDFSPSLFLSDLEGRYKARMCKS